MENKIIKTIIQLINIPPTKQKITEIIKTKWPGISREERKKIIKKTITLYNAIKFLEKRFPEQIIPVRQMVFYSIKTPFHFTVLEQAAEEINRKIKIKTPNHNIWAFPTPIQYLLPPHRGWQKDIK